MSRTRLTLSQQLETALADKERLFQECQEFRSGQDTAVKALETLQNEVVELRSKVSLYASQIGDLTTKLAAAEKETKEAKSTYTYAQEGRVKAEGELEQVHAILDSLEGAPSRTFQVEGAYSETKRTLSARFAVALCTIFRLTSDIKKVG